MKRGLALICATCLILGFQNCSQSNLQSGSGLTQDVAINAPNLSTGNGEDISGVTSKVTFVEIPNMAEDSSVAQKASASELTPYRLVISLQSGTINLMDERNEVLEKRCLNSSSLQELKTILGGSSICAAAAVDSSTMCAQVYSPGYASLYADDQRIALGERKDSCGSGQKDLCGALSDVFQNYVSHVRQNWADMACN